jgi:hypothetical protein
VTNVSTILDSLRCQLAAHGYHLTDAELLDVSRNVAQATMRDELPALFDAFADCPQAQNTMLQLHDRDGSIAAALHTWASERNLKVSACTAKSGSVSQEVELQGVEYRWAKIVVHDSRTARRAEADPVSATNPTDPTWSVAQHSMGEMP